MEPIYVINISIERRRSYFATLFRRNKGRITDQWAKRFKNVRAQAKQQTMYRAVHASHVVSASAIWYSLKWATNAGPTTIDQRARERKGCQSAAEIIIAAHIVITLIELKSEQFAQTQIIASLRYTHSRSRSLSFAFSLQSSALKHNRFVIK